MVFNPLFLQNTSGVENIHPEKVNKLSGSGYLFSDIINVFMNADENDSLTKLTQEFLGSAQIKENNGSPVILSLLGETSIPLSDVSKNLQLKIEDFLPSGLKKKLVKTEGEADKNVVEKSLTVDQKQLAQILETINQLLGIGKQETKNSDENADVDLSETVNLLEGSDGVFVIVETADKIFNVNITKVIPEKTIDVPSEIKTGTAPNENLYKIKFTAINDKSLYSPTVNENLVSGAAQNNSQLSFLPFESEAAETNAEVSSVKLKVFTYQNTVAENVLPDSPNGKLKFAEQTVETHDKNPSKEIKTAETTFKPVQNNAPQNTETKNVLTSQGEKEATKESGKSVNPKTSAEVSGKSAEPKTIADVSEKAKVEITKITEPKILSSEKDPAVNIQGKEKVNEDGNILNKAIKNFEKTKEEILVDKNEVKVKEILPSVSKTELKETVEYKTDTKESFSKPDEKITNEKVDENIESELSTKDFEKFVLENKESEQLNIKVTKAVKHITTIKAENTQQANSEKPVKENAETKSNESDEKIKPVQSPESNEKNFSQSENFFKQSEEGKNFGFDSKINTSQVKEKFVLDEPLPHSNSERIVKAAEIMKELSKFIEKQDKTTLTIRISPEDLGKLKITLDVVDQNVKANIHVENEAVKTIIEKNIVELQNQMSKNGIQLTSVNVSLSESDQKNAKQFAGKKKTNSFDINEKGIDENEEEKIKMMGYNTVEYLA